jgi:alpha-1,3/alpha-1,6-mannosyltransferase
MKIQRETKRERERERERERGSDRKAGLKYSKQPNSNRQVTIYTAHHDRSRAFAETVDGPFRVVVAGAWFPRSLARGRAIALCAYVRCVLAAIRIAWDGREEGKRWDAAVADQVSAAVPVLQLLLAPAAAVLFYCHFPDLLLAKPRPAGSLSAWLHALDRRPLDAVEQASTGSADRILVNSEFTAGVFATTFPRLARRGVAPRVLYPAASIPSDEALRGAREGWREALPAEVVSLVEGGGGSKPAVFVSVNRFEGKKGLPLALRALGALDELLLQQQVAPKETGAPAAGEPKARAPPPPPVLVFAGGFDARLPENASVLLELQRLAAELGLSSRVAFLPSFSDEQRGALLAVATAVLYTPENEHFGIVPVEAAAAAVPVVACSSGGPKESVMDGETGFLRRPEPVEFARAMLELVRGEGGGGRAEAMGAAARRRAAEVFSRSAFGAELEREVREMVQEKEEKKKSEKDKKRR